MKKLVLSLCLFLGSISLFSQSLPLTPLVTKGSFQSSLTARSITPRNEASATSVPLSQMINTLVINQTAFDNNAIVTYKDKISWGSGTVDSGDGGGTFTVYITGMPKSISFDYSRNSYGKNRVLKLEESNDGTTWTQVMSTDPSTSWTTFQGALKRTTRYLRFSYSADYKLGDVWSRYGYWRNITIYKNSIQANTESIADFMAGVGGASTPKTFLLQGANLTGDLALVSSNEHFSVSPATLTKEQAATVNGVPVEVTFTPKTRGTVDGSITITDSGNSGNYFAISLNGFASSAQVSATTPAPFETIEGSKITQTIDVTTSDLEGPVTLTLSGTNASYFSLDKESMITGGKVTISYAPAQYGSHSATLTLTSLYAQTVTVPLEGTATKSPLNGMTNTLIIDQPAFNNNAIVTNKSAVSWGSGSIDTGDGGGSFVVQINGIPKSISFDYSRNNYGGNRVLKLEESKDGTSWTQVMSVDPSTSWTNYRGALKPSTRFLKFSYTSEYQFGDVWSRYGYWRNITIYKSNLQSTTQLINDFTAALGKTDKKSFLLQGINLTGTLSLVSSNDRFSVTPATLTQEEAAPLNGVPVEVTFAPNSTGVFEGSIEITDTENSENYLSVSLLGTCKPNAPHALAAKEVMLNSFTAQWDKAEGVLSYLVSVFKEGVALTEFDKVNAGDLSSLVINGLTPDTEYTYRVWSVGAGNLISEESSESILVRTLAQPRLELSQPASFTTTTGVATTQEITINGSNLLDKITIAISGTNANLFTLDKSELLTSGVVKVTYSPTAAGTHTANLQVATLYADGVTVPLNASAKPAKPVCVAAGQVTPIGFTANWQAVAGVTDYRIWVKEANGNVVANYDGKSVGAVTLFAVAGLQPETTYSYQVVASLGTLISEPSNTIEVTTQQRPVITYSPIGAFETKMNVETSQTIQIGGERLTRYVSLEMSGSNFFSTDKNEIAAQGENLTIYFLPTEPGLFEAELRLNTPFAEPVTIALHGKSLDLTTVATLPRDGRNYITCVGETLHTRFPSETDVSFFNMQGVKVREIKTEHDVVNLNTLQSGIYILHFSVDGTPYCVKINLP